MNFKSQVQADAVSLIVADSIEGAKVRLFTNEITPDPGTALAAFTEATFSGYAASADLAFGDMHQGPDAKWRQLSNRVEFNHSGGAVAELVQGFYVVQGVAPATPVLVAAHRFDEPKSMASVADQISIVLAIGSVLSGTPYMQ